ncbi:hypothetical protein [Vibrio crassostreae]|nr:hypothetical protein [Vibrio crassostreae]CAK2036633.1 hypothetical protein VCRA2117O328_30171 [Vibrio crassostreae]CAK2053324.1 hypothetical protein VCRA2114E5_410002 [Vibrio crassostreae]CAK2062751.1 hypothetical protein VCRA2110O4_480001 [Vibrio crassostreae]CAK2067885.1 hypothetical protein VCRA2110O1_450002 [Vibrio crassostreae]CAK2329616.1 hypothetical protein VCRA2110O318_30130 [Vibrio crassostreae]
MDNYTYGKSIYLVFCIDGSAQFEAAQAHDTIESGSVMGKILLLP